MDGNQALTTSSPSATVSPTVVNQAAKVVQQADDPVELGIELVLDAGKRVRLPAELGDFVFSIITQTSQNCIVSVRSMPEDLTTSVAAGQLGVSRPTLMKMLKRGDLPSHMVGTHTRVKYADVVEFRRAREEARKDALAALLEADTSSDDD